MEEINGLQIIKNAITRPRHPQARRNPTFYPSSASVKLSDNRVMGGCWRADWYRIHGVPESDHAGLYMHMIWELGRAVERKIIDAMKTGGIYENDGVKFYDEEHNVSGELDIVGRYRKAGQIRYYGVEVKSVYGHGATKTIIGRSRAWRGQPAFDPFPKESNLMQTMKYLWEFRSNGPSQFALDFFKIIYLPRDKPNDGREYTVTLVTRDDLDSEMLGIFGQEMRPGEHYAMVSTEGFTTKVEVRWSLEDMHTRWKEEIEHFASHKIPPRPFHKFYNEEQIEYLYSINELGKTAYTDWEKAGKPLASLEKTPGHFLCQSYCDYRSFCYTKTGKPRVEADRVGLVSIEEPREE